MIVDKDKRFIFVHNPRTGGTSIRSVLRQYQDDEMYTDDQRLKIEKIFEPEIEKYGYEF